MQAFEKYSLLPQAYGKQSNEIGPWFKYQVIKLICIHKYLRQFRYSYWWRAPHVGIFKRSLELCLLALFITALQSFLLCYAF